MILVTARGVQARLPPSEITESVASVLRTTPRLQASFVVPAKFVALLYGC